MSLSRGMCTVHAYLLHLLNRFSHKRRFSLKNIILYFRHIFFMDNHTCLDITTFYFTL